MKNFVFSFVIQSLIRNFAIVMDIDTLKGLSSCPLFGGLTEQEIIDLMRTVRYRVVSFRKGNFA